MERDRERRLNGNVNGKKSDWQAALNGTLKAL